MKDGEKQACKASWNDMLPELLGRCFNNMDARYRCNTIPCVSRAFLQAHTDTPPMLRKTWRLDCMSMPITHPMLAWFGRICADLEELEIYNLADPGNPDCLLSELLSTAATAAPNLRCLTLQNSDGIHPARLCLISSRSSPTSQPSASAAWAKLKRERMMPPLPSG